MIPYELIGRGVVYSITALVIVAVIALVIGLLLYAWNRLFVGISNYMWKGHDFKDSEDYPPLWKLRASGVALALGKFKFRKVVPAYYEAEDIAEDETTFIQYLENVFIKDT